MKAKNQAMSVKARKQRERSRKRFFCVICGGEMTGGDNCQNLACQIERGSVKGYVKKRRRKPFTW